MTHRAGYFDVYLQDMVSVDHETTCKSHTSIVNVLVGRNKQAATIF